MPAASPPRNRWRRNRSRGYSLTGRLADGAITPAAIWLLDNYYLVERQIHDIRANVPPGYYRQLPKLTNGPFARYPRVFGVAWVFGAALLPALALRDGIPPELRILVAVPMLLTSTEETEKQIGRLEVHYLASPEAELHFALLSDWPDAATEHTDADAGLLKTTADGIARLNLLHGPRFLLLHRHRVWNAGEACWLGWERKRGKLRELNRLLPGATDTTFLISGVPADIRYVVTLDADTRVPRDTVRRLIGAMAHPLNQPRLEAALGRVVEGHAVMQPRVTPSLPVAFRPGRAHANSG